MKKCISLFIQLIFISLLSACFNDNKGGNDLAKLLFMGGSSSASLELNDISLSATDGCSITLAKPSFRIISDPQPTVQAYIGPDTSITWNGPSVANFSEGPIDVFADGYKFAGLNPNTYYRIVVVAQNSVGYSLKTIRQRTGNLAPELNDLVITRYDAGSITLAQPTFSVAGYPLPGVSAFIGIKGTITISGYSVSNYITGDINVSANGYTFSGLKSDMIYTIVVVGRNIAGYSVKQIDQELKLDIYAGGYSNNSSGISVAGYWRNGSWNVLTPLSESNNSCVNSVVVSEGVVYAGGYSTNASNVKVAGYWEHGAWVGLPSISASSDSSVNSLIVSGDNVYAGGYSTNASNVKLAGYWINGIWNSLTQLSATGNSCVNSITISGQDVYAGGYSINASNMKIPGYWKNGVWNGLESPLSANDVTGHGKRDTWVNSIVVSANVVYAVGFGSYAVHQNYSDDIIYYCQCYWRNGALLCPESSMQYAPKELSSIFLSGNFVYAGGSRRNDSGVQVACYWSIDSQGWDTRIDLPGIAGNLSAYVSSLFIAGDVYAGGYCYNSSNHTVPGYWKNGSWNSLTPLSSGDSAVTSLIIVAQ